MVLHHVSREVSPLGIVVGLLGVVAVVGYDGLKRILKVGDSLVEGDKVVTGDQGGVVIGLASGESISVGQDAELPVDIANFGESAYQPGGVEILQAMKDGLLAGQSASDLLAAAADGRLGQSPVYIQPADSSAMPGSGGGSTPGGGNGGDTPVDDPIDPPPVLPQPVISVSDLSITEPAADASVPQGQASGAYTTAVFTISLSEASNQDITIHYRTVDGTATSSPEQGNNPALADYQHEAGVITIPAGETSATITITVNGDSLVEGDETFTLHIHHVDGAVIGDDIGVGVIIDNEPNQQGQGGSDNGNTFGGTDSTPGKNEATDGDDILHGTGGHDTISALDGDDVVFGAGGDDSLKGGHGNDSLIGGAGDDNLVGNLGDDVLLGQIGDDILSGNAGDDLLLGGRGADQLSGGGGSDVFAFTSLSDAGDVITDFKANQNDAIDISEILDGYSDGDDLSGYVNVVQEGGDLQLHVDPTGSSDFTLLVTIQDAASQLSTDPVDLLAEGSLIINSNTIV